MSGKTQVDRSIDIGRMFDLDIPHDGESGLPLATVSEQYYSMDDLILGEEIKKRLGYIIRENNNLDRLLEYGLKPKQKILLCGPPGTGKTLTSKIIASTMGLPLVRVEFDSLISSFLGKTGSNLRRVFDLAEKSRCVMLFDEFDMIAKSRDDEQEHGEMKRVISSFMQLVEGYNGRGILIAASNHQHLLDSAVWRRFDDILLYDIPDLGRRRLLLERYLAALGYSEESVLRAFASRTNGFSAADIAGVCEDAMRNAIIEDRKKVTKNDLTWAVQERRRRKKIMRSS